MLSPRALVRGNPARAKFAAENTRYLTQKGHKLLYIYVCVAWLFWLIFDDLYSNEHAEQNYSWDAALTVRTLLYNLLRHIIDSGNGLSIVRHEAIVWTNGDTSASLQLTSMKPESKHKHYISKKCFGKCRLQNIDQYDQESGIRNVFFDIMLVT